MKRLFLLMIAALLVAANCAQGPTAYSSTDECDDAAGVTGGPDGYTQRHE